MDSSLGLSLIRKHPSLPKCRSSRASTRSSYTRQSVLRCSTSRPNHPVSRLTQMARRKIQDSVYDRLSGRLEADILLLEGGTDASACWKWRDSDAWRISAGRVEYQRGVSCVSSSWRRGYADAQVIWREPHEWLKDTRGRGIVQCEHQFCPPEYCPNP